jgi:hypothetical protein
MPVSADRCQETTTTTGTGNVTLLGAVTQYQSFSAAFPNTPQANIEYAIIGQASSEWEVGEGTLVNSTTFSRDTIRASSNSNAAVSFSAGTKNIFATLTGERAGAILAPKITPVNLASFSWMNQGSATFTQTDSFAYLAAPALNGINVRAQVKNVPGSKPYSVVMGFMTNLQAINTMHCGFMLSDGTKVITFGPQYNTSTFANTLGLVAFKLTNVTTYNSNYQTLACWPRDRWWLKYRDDGTNRTFSYSGDGVNFLPLVSSGNTDFLTPTTWGFFSDPENGSWGLGISVFSWTEGT